MKIKLLQTDPPALLLSHENSTYLFGVPRDLPSGQPPTTIFSLSKSAVAANALAAATSIPCYTTTTVNENNLTITPIADSGYLVKSADISFGYFPNIPDSVPSEAASARILFLENTPRAAAFIKDNHLTGSYLIGQDINTNDEIELRKKQYTTEEAGYGPSISRNRQCADCRYFNISHEVAKSITLHPISDFDISTLQQHDSPTHITGTLKDGTQAIQSVTFLDETPDQITSWSTTHSIPLQKATTGGCEIVPGSIDPTYTCWYFEPRTLQPLNSNDSTPIHLEKLFPVHDTYVEPYLTSTLFLSKTPSDVEVLADPDKDLVDLYKRICTLSDVEIRYLQQLDWSSTQTPRRRAPTSDLRKIHTHLIKSAAPYGLVHNRFRIPNRIAEIRERLQEATIVNHSLSQLSKDYDSPTTFFYIEPPDSALEEVIALTKTLKGQYLIKAKRAIPGGFERAGYFYRANYIPAPTTNTLLKSSDTTIDENLTYEPIDEETILIAKSSDERRLVWTVNMVPYKVDHEGHWADEDTVLQAAHNFMLRDVPIWTEHKQLLKSAKPVQSYTLLSDLNINRPNKEPRTIKKGSWVTVLWISDAAEWAKVKTGDYYGTSIRSTAKARTASPPTSERTETPLYKLFSTKTTA